MKLSYPPAFLCSSHVHHPTNSGLHSSGSCDKAHLNERTNDRCAHLWLALFALPRQYACRSLKCRRDAPIGSCDAHVELHPTVQLSVPLRRYGYGYDRGTCGRSCIERVRVPARASACVSTTSRRAHTPPAPPLAVFPRTTKGSIFPGCIAAFPSVILCDIVRLINLAQHRSSKHVGVRGLCMRCISNCGNTKARRNLRGLKEVEEMQHYLHRLRLRRTRRRDRQDRSSGRTISYSGHELERTLQREAAERVPDDSRRILFQWLG